MCGDSYKRIEIADGIYQCGCHWIRDEEYGNVLVEFKFRSQITKAKVHKLERECRLKIIKINNLYI